MNLKSSFQISSGQFFSVGFMDLDSAVCFPLPVSVSPALLMCVCVCVSDPLERV